MKITIPTRLNATTPGYAEARQRLLTAVAIHRDACGITSTTVPTVTGRTPVTIIARGDAARLGPFLERMDETLTRYNIGQ
jgi:hypothetical protein